MPTLLFRLRNVPEDEADEVRDLLERNNIEYYETAAGKWQISFPAIWLRNDTQLQQARQLLSAYQQQRYSDARRDYELMKKRGEERTFLDNLLENPLRVIASGGLIVLILYLSVQFFLSMN